MLSQVPDAGDAAAETDSARGVLRWLMRVEKALLDRYRQNVQLVAQIRGAGVAVDSLIYSLIRFTQWSDFDLVVPDRQYEAICEWSGHLPRNGEQAIQISRLSDVAGCGVTPSRPDILLNLYGDCDASFRLRNRIAHTILPTVTLQHALSHPARIYDRFLRMMLMTSLECDALVCPSRAAKRALAAILESLKERFQRQTGGHIGFEGRMEVIPLCVDTDRFRPAKKMQVRKSLNFPSDSVLLLYIGYLSQVKADLVPMLGVIRKVAAANPESKVRVIIAGTGPQEYCDLLKRTIEELRLHGFVDVLLHISESHKLQLLQAADVFLAPSDTVQESFGLAPVEAMACGVPQIAAAWDGYSETVVHGETGFLVPTYWCRCDEDFYNTGELLGWEYDHVGLGQSVAIDTTAMCQAMNELIRSPERRADMAEASRRRALAEFSYRKVASSYEELWDELRSIADRVRIPSAVRSFDLPQYFDYFSHYAAEEVSDDWVVECDADPPLSLEQTLVVTGSSVPCTIVDAAMLRSVYSLVEAMGSISMREILSQVRHGGVSDATVRRHVLLLLKYGLVIKRDER